MSPFFRNLTTRQLVIIGLVVPLLCTILIGWLQWRVVRDMKDGRTVARQIRAAQVALGVFRYSLSDAESCQFRFILTHNPDDIALYRKLVAQAKLQFDLLRKLSAANETQQGYLDQIEPLLKTKLTMADQSFTLEQNGDHSGAMQIISSDAGRQNMLAIERALEDMQAVEAQLVVDRQNIFSHNLNVATKVSAAGLLVNLGCIAAILLLIRRLQDVQSQVTLDAMREMIHLQDGTLTIEEYLRHRAEALTTHGKAQIEAEKLISQLERRRARHATERVPTKIQTPST